MSDQINLAIFASGGGSNALKIVKHFERSADISVKLIASNKPKAKVLDLCPMYGLSQLVFEKQFFNNASAMSYIFKAEDIDYIILAGFLWKIPPHLIELYPGRILNIHPSLLPKYGGPGMYGLNVHKAVVDAKEKISGPTIHVVNEKYDDGKILFQKSVDISGMTNPKDVASAVLKLEHLYYPTVIASYCTEKKG